MPPALKQEDKEIILLLERDIPNLQERIEKMEDSLDKVKETVSKNESSLVNIATSLSLLKEDIKSITNKEDKDWYKDFRNVLIVILLISVLALSGVKAYESIINGLTPWPSTSSENL